MKTKNNVQKAALKITTVIVSIVLIGLNVNAQGLFREFMSNDKYEETGFAYVASSNSSGEINTNSYLHSEFYLLESENDLEIEEWMLDETYFNCMVLYSEIEIEQALEVEDWMTNEKYFNVQELEVNTEFKDEVETGLELESWMTDDIIWK